MRQSCAVLSRYSCVRLFATLWNVACQALLSMRFSRQECWSGLPCPPLRDRPNLGIKPLPLMSPALAGRFFTTSATWEAPEVKLAVGHIAKPPLIKASHSRHEVLHNTETYFKLTYYKRSGVWELGKIFLTNHLKKAWRQAGPSWGNKAVAFTPVLLHLLHVLPRPAPPFTSCSLFWWRTADSEDELQPTSDPGLRFPISHIIQSEAHSHF